MHAEALGKDPAAPRFKDNLGAPSASKDELGVLPAVAGGRLSPLAWATAGVHAEALGTDPAAPRTKEALGAPSASFDEFGIRPAEAGGRHVVQAAADMSRELKFRQSAVGPEAAAARPPAA